MTDLTLQAQVAAQHDDWSTVTLLLQRLLLADTAPTLEVSQDAALLDLALQVLALGDFQSQWEVAKVFSRFGSAAIAPLIDLLQDDLAELESRWFAARILGDLNDPVAIRALVEQLHHSDDEDLSRVVAEALANLGTSAIAALTELLTSTDTRRFAVQALAQIHQSDIVTPLLSVVNDPDAEIRTSAISALSSFHHAQITPVLVAALHDSAATVRRTAIAGLSVRPDLLESWNLVDQLAQCLWDLNPSVCQQAALALGKLGQDAAVPALERALIADHTPLPLRLDIVRALSWIGTQQALTSLQHSLTATPAKFVEPVYQEIITLMGRWSEPSLQAIASQILIDVLTTHEMGQLSVNLRRTLAIALGELKQPEALEPLLQLLADSDSGVQLHAIAALKQLDADAAYARLATLSSNQTLPENLRKGIIVALREWETELPR